MIYLVLFFPKTFILSTNSSPYCMVITHCHRRLPTLEFSYIKNKHQLLYVGMTIVCCYSNCMLPWQLYLPQQLHRATFCYRGNRVLSQQQYATIATVRYYGNCLLPLQLDVAMAAVCCHGNCVLPRQLSVTIATVCYHGNRELP